MKGKQRERTRDTRYMAWAHKTNGQKNAGRRGHIIWQNRREENATRIILKQYVLEIKKFILRTMGNLKDLKGCFRT